jgi:hypothetical protein
LLNTRICIPIDCWDKQNLCIIENLPSVFGDSYKLNENLKEQVRLAENLIAFALKNGIKDIGSFIKEYSSPDLNIYDFSDLVKKREQEKKKKQNAKFNLDFFFQIDDYIASKIKKVSKDMPRIYRNMKDHLLEFQAFRNNPSRLIASTSHFMRTLLIFFHLSMYRSVGKNILLG